MPLGIDPQAIRAREAGRAEGCEVGAYAGQVQLLQSLLGEPEQSLSDRMELGEAALVSLLAEPQQRLQSCRG